MTTAHSTEHSRLRGQARGTSLPIGRADVAMLLPDGVGVRNFVLGPFLEETAGDGTLCIFHGLPPDLVDVYQSQIARPVQWLHLSRGGESHLQTLVRNALAYAQMYWSGTWSTKCNLALPLGGSRLSKMRTRAARLVGRVAASQTGIRALDRLHCALVARSSATASYRRILAELRPSVLLSSNQRPAEVVAPVLAARSLGIPTAGFIFSWDNLTSKGRIVAPFDHYLVWSNHMRDELLHYYPDVTADRVHVVGTPQFDPYADTRLIWSREAFLASIGADPNRPLICYSAGEPATCPEDPEQLAVLLEAVRAGRIKGNPQVVLRPTPTVAGSHFSRLRHQYPELLYAQPRWMGAATVDRWTSVFPTKDDVQFIANLTHHADLNVNVASTMTLDFAIHDRPVVNVAFDVKNPPPLGKRLWDSYYQFEHYRPVVEFGAARFARSPDELVEHVNAYLADPALDRVGRRRFVELEVGVPIGQSGRRINETLERIRLERIRRSGSVSADTRDVDALSTSPSATVRARPGLS